jgi:hypothetical protein
MQDIRGIADHILADSREHREAMLQLIASREAIAFAGAGLSAPLGYPPWKRLLQSLRSKAGDVVPFQPPADIPEDDALNYAEAIQRHFEKHEGNPNRYYAILGREFGSKPQGCSETQQRLVRLPFKGYVTTNYDLTIERAFQRLGTTRPDCAVVVKRKNKDAHKVSEFLLSLDDTNHVRRVAHLHGVENDTEQIILSASDYYEAYGFAQDDRGRRHTREWTLHRKLAWSLLATRRIVFIGSSLNDPYVSALLDAVVDDLWNFGQPIHYAVTPLEQASLEAASARAAHFLNRYGVQLVYYDNLDGNHDGLDQLVTEALTRCGEPVGRDWLEDVNRDTERALKPHED